MSYFKQKIFQEIGPNGKFRNITMTDIAKVSKALRAWCGHKNIVEKKLCGNLKSRRWHKKRLAINARKLTAQQFKESGRSYPAMKTSQDDPKISDRIKASLQRTGYHSKI